MLPPELSLRSPVPSLLAMNNCAPEGPMRLTKMVLRDAAGGEEANARPISSRKAAEIVIPSFVMEEPLIERIVRFRCPRHNDFDPARVRSVGNGCYSSFSPLISKHLGAECRGLGCTENNSYFSSEVIFGRGRRAFEASRRASG